MADAERLTINATIWQPLSTAPRDGKFLVAKYAPTNWAYSIETVQTNSNMPPRHRAIQLRYARAWQPMLDEPPEEMRDVTYD